MEQFPERRGFGHMDGIERIELKVDDILDRLTRLEERAVTHDDLSNSRRQMFTQVVASIAIIVPFFTFIIDSVIGH